MTLFRYAIVLYAYNQEHCVREAVRALLAQECAPLEILLSDDCSTDATYAVLEQEASAYNGPHHVTLNRNPSNLGVIGHVNRIFSILDADVMINCAGDDLSHPQRARRMIETFEREQPLLACSHAKVEYADGTPGPRTYAKADFYRRCDALGASTSFQLYLGATAAWHRDIHDKYGPIVFDDAFEDLVFGFRAALEGRVAVVEEELLTYRLGGVTDSTRQPETRHQFRQRRKKELSRDISILTQRQMDARSFGLAPSDPVMRRLERAIFTRRLRLDYVERGNAALPQAGLRHPWLILGAALSEKGRWRRASSKAR